MHEKIIIIIMVDGRSSNNGDTKTWRDQVCTLDSLKDEMGEYNTLVYLTENNQVNSVSIY